MYVVVKWIHLAGLHVFECKVGELLVVENSICLGSYLLLSELEQGH